MSISDTSSFTTFADRREAGRLLAKVLPPSVHDEKVVILALPRGGVPVAAEVARELGQPFDVLIVRKLGLPGHPECAMGAIAGGGIKVLDEELIARQQLTEDQVASVVRRETSELARREERYRTGGTPPEVSGRTVIVVDDGIATGATVSAAVELLHSRNAGRIIVAAPVAPMDTVDRLRREADEVVVLQTPEPFGAVGRWYRDFSETSDEEVVGLLGRTFGGSS
jgi:predicted phosphoribosyltransferase